MKIDPMTPYGQALQDYYRGDHSASLKIIRDDGQESYLPVRVFFRDETEFSYIEQLAVGLSSGHVLDIGAGSGIHSLYLQNKQIKVTAIDISHDAVEIMKSRGVQNTECIDIYDFKGKGFDTLLLLSHGIGLTGTIDGLRKFLKHAYEITASQGILLIDTLDVRHSEDPVNISYHERNKKLNRNVGEISMQFEYKGIKGDPFSWLHLIPETLIMESDRSGWNCEIVHREPTGDYLARLSKK